MLGSSTATGPTGPSNVPATGAVVAGKICVVVPAARSASITLSDLTFAPTSDARYVTQRPSGLTAASSDAIRTSWDPSLLTDTRVLTPGSREIATGAAGPLPGTPRPWLVTAARAGTTVMARANHAATATPTRRRDVMPSPDPRPPQGRTNPE